MVVSRPRGFGIEASERRARYTTGRGEREAHRRYASRPRVKLLARSVRREAHREPREMPELPEVETVRRDLETRVIGRTITSCWIARDAARLIQLVTPEEFCRQLTGRGIAGLRRRGKYLIVDLDDTRAWVIHRRMSGNVLYRTAADLPD